MAFLRSASNTTELSTLEAIFITILVIGMLVLWLIARLYASSRFILMAPGHSAGAESIQIRIEYTPKLAGLRVENPELPTFNLPESKKDI